MTAIVGIGRDLVECARLGRILEGRLGERFKRRVFTDHERQYCDSKPKPLEHYAARFAAKEAAFKALGTGVWRAQMGWHQVEVGKAGDGAPELRFHGAALQRARSLGVCKALVSLTHAGGMAAAQVLLQNREDRIE